MITTLKRDNQRLMEDNARLKEKPKENTREAPSRDSRDTPARESREESIINSIKKARKLIDSQSSHTGRDDPAPPPTDDPLKFKRHSLSSIKPNK